MRSKGSGPPSVSLVSCLPKHAPVSISLYWFLLWFFFFFFPPPSPISFHCSSLPTVKYSPRFLFSFITFVLSLLSYIRPKDLLATKVTLFLTSLSLSHPTYFPRIAYPTTPFPSVFPLGLSLDTAPPFCFHRVNDRGYPLQVVLPKNNSILTSRPRH